MWPVCVCRDVWPVCVYRDVWPVCVCRDVWPVWQYRDVWLVCVYHDVWPVCVRTLAPARHADKGRRPSRVPAEADDDEEKGVKLGLFKSFNASAGGGGKEAVRQFFLSGIKHDTDGKC